MTVSKKADLIVIGAGPAGIMTALTAAQSGLKVVLIERNKTIGRKLAITGSGRCNLTNQSSLDHFILNIPGNGRFLYGILKRFGPPELMDFVQNALHVPLKVERGNRVFPESDRAQDIVEALERNLRALRIELITGVRVDKLLINESQGLAGVACDNGTRIEAYLVTIATGGASYPGTGSTGDGYQFAKKAGHTIVDLMPSLVPLETKEEWPKQLQGLSLVNVNVEVIHQGKKQEHEFGEMLFTHYGISGPTILSLSRKITPLVVSGRDPVYVRIDLKPALSEEELDLRVQRDFDKYIRKIYQNSLDDLLPQKMIPVIIDLSGIDPQKPVHQITRQERLNLVRLMKNLVVTIQKPRPISEAIVTAGGVNTKEINPKTLESKKMPGLYFAGEVVDVDAYTGGFNLQIAFSMGYVAGMEAARKHFEINAPENENSSIVVSH